QDIARVMFEQIRETARTTNNSINTRLQLGPDIAALTPLARIYWLQGFPDRAISTLHDAIEVALRSNHWYSLYYVLVFAGFPLALWVGDLVSAQKYLDLMINSTGEIHRRKCFEFILNLRHGDENDRLVAAFLECRLDTSTFLQILKLSSTSKF